MQNGKLDVWAHDIYISVESENLIENIIENIYRYIKDIVEPHSIVITRRRTEEERNEAYYLLPAVKILGVLKNDEIKKIIEKWEKIKGASQKSKDVTQKIKDEVMENINDCELLKTNLSKEYSKQKIRDDELLFKLYKNQIKDDQTIIIIDKY